MKMPETMLVVLMGLCLTAFVDLSSGAFCYGYVKEIATSGASCITAKLNKLKYCGHVASLQMAEADFKRLAKYKVTIGIVAHNLCIEPSVIAAIISRESHVGASLKNGMDAGGKYFGLMQLSKEWHKVKGDWDSAEHITQGTEVLIQMMKSIQTKFPTWTINQQLKGAIAAYNCGPGNVKTYPEVDKYTTGRDYSNDVVARAIYFKVNGF
ncbi:lysozyme g-like [Lissotriton helveticus]